MENETKKELNEKIAILLGFKKHVNSYGTHWAYPKEYEDLVSGSPESAIPDFINLINISIDLSRKFKYGPTREFFYEKA